MWITGEVRDEAGRLLSGVDVELSGSELASSTRKVVTNSRGQYTIVDLRPGTYSVKFARSGFAPILREPIDLTTRFVATIVAHLKTCAPD